MTAARAELASGAGCVVNMGAVGTQWFLRQLAALSATGVLHVMDDCGDYGCRVSGGLPTGAAARTPASRAEDFAAVAALCLAKGPQGAFNPSRASDSRLLAPTMEELLDRVSAAVNRLAERGLSRSLSGGAHFEANTALYTLFRKMASPAERAICEELVERRTEPGETAARLGRKPEEVQRVVRELLRRQVLPAGLSAVS